MVTSTFLSILTFLPFFEKTMKTFIIYSSGTGNTAKLAYGIRAIFSDNTHIFPIEQAPTCGSADLYLLGFWVRRGAPDSRMASYMAQLRHKHVAFFGTLGAYPNSPHAQKVLENTTNLLHENTLLGSFLCQGKIHNSLANAMQANTRLRSSHPMTPERIARHKEAAKHPNADDIHAAQQYFLKIKHQAQTKIGQKRQGAGAD